MPKRRTTAKKQEKSSNVVNKKRKTRKRGKTKNKVVSKPPSNLTKENVLTYLKANCDKDLSENSPDDTDDPTTEEVMTLADRFICRYIDFGDSDGNGLKNVKKVFEYLKTIKKTKLPGHQTSNGK